MRFIKHDVTSKLVILTSLVLFSMSVVYSQHYQPTTISIVNNYMIGWVLFFSSVGIMSVNVFINYDRFRIIEKTCVIIHGVGALAFISALPYMVGYYMVGRGDTLTHLGWIRDIVELGKITSELIYPVFHLLSSTLVYIAKIELRWAMVVTLIITIFGATGSMVAIFQRIGKRTYPPIALFSIVVLIMLSFPFRTYHISYYPAGLSTLYLPITIISTYHLIELRSRVYPAFIYVFTTLSHPFGFIYTLLIISVFSVKSITGIKSYSLSREKYLVSYTIISCILLLGYFWYDYAGVFQNLVFNSFETLFVDTDTASNVQHTSSTLENVPIIEFVLIRYSPHVYLLPVTILTPILMYIKNRSLLREYGILYIWGVLSLVIGVITFFATSLIGPLRFIDASPAIWISIISLLYLVFGFSSCQIPSDKYKSVIILLLILSLPVTLISGFPSPLTYQNSWEISHEDRATGEWWIEHGNKQYTESLGLPRGVFYTKLSFSRDRAYEPRGEFRTYRGRADLFERKKLKLQEIEVGDESTLSVLDSNNLIIITKWHTLHASNTKLTNNRNITAIHNQYDHHGSKWLENNLNKIYTNGDNKVLSK